MSNNQRTSEDYLKEISEKLDKIYAVLSIQNIDDVDKKIYLLKKSGFLSEQIGPFVDMKGTSVRDRKGWKQK